MADSDMEQRGADLGSLDYGVPNITDEELELRQSQLESLNVDAGSVNQADNNAERFGALQELQR